MPAESQGSIPFVAPREPGVAEGFQLLQTLIRVRLRSVADPACRHHLNWLFDIVTALGLLQRRVGEGQPLDFGEYLSEAVAYWTRVVDTRPITFQVETQGEALDMERASTLALIAHELIDNAVQHAFASGGAGVVRLTLSADRDGWREFMVSDDGAAIDVDALERGSGLELAASLAEHIGGAFSLAHDGGTEARVRFPSRAGPQTH